jgi:P4 family phage/plasmid primase-like protien
VGVPAGFWNGYTYVAHMPPQPKTKNQEIAEKILGDGRYQKNLLFCRGWNMFYLYADGWYRDLGNGQFEALVWEFIREYAPELNITAGLVHDVIQQIKWIIPHKVEEIKTPYIAFADKLLDTDTFQFEDFERKKVAIHRLECTSEDTKKSIPQFEQFINSTMVNNQKFTDPELVRLIQEMFGYYLLNAIKPQVVFFLVGQGANGKSVMLQVLERMIGSKFVSAMSIQSLTMNQFATSGLIGKKVNICNEEESKYLRSDKFKALISGDMVQAERKFEGQFFFRPTTKYVFATNQMPTFDGINYGIKRRMMVIPFKRIFKPDEQNHQLVDELIAELPGIIGWAITGANRLVKQGYKFSTAQAVKESIEDFENLTSSALLFVREGYRHDSDGFIDYEDLYKTYQDWCIKVGKKPLSMTLFNRDLRDNLGVEVKVKWSTEKNKTVRGHNLSLKQEVGPDLTMEAVAAVFDEPAPVQGTIV